MQGLQRLGRRWVLCVVYVGGLLTAFYGYVLLRVRPELFYQQNSSVFLCDADFFARFLDRPGGLAEYASAFVSPLFASGWIGAVVITVCTACICLATRRLLVAVAGTGGQIVFLIPALLILLVLGQYIHPVLWCVSLSAVLMLALTYVRIGGRRLAVRLPAFFLGSLLAYYLTAGWSVVFACWCGVFEWRVSRRRFLSALYLLSAVAIPSIAGAWLFDLGITESFRGPLPPSSPYWFAASSSSVAIAIQAGLCLFFLAAAVCVRRRPCPALPVADPTNHDSPAIAGGAVGSSRGLLREGRLAIQTAALVAFAIGADLLLFDFPAKCRLQIARSAERQRWADVLRYARHLPPDDIWVAFHVNRAMYFSGGLLDRMFAAPQAAGAPSLTLRFDSLVSMAQMAPLECSDIFFDLGRINESEHMAYEALEILGERPQTLERLVQISVLKEQPEVARTYLALLDRSLSHRRWARHCRQQLDEDPTLSAVPEVASRRELMVDCDSVGKLDVETMLQQLLDKNRRNRMAFEYLMAHYLLTRQLDRLAANLPRLADFDYPCLPRHLEEAAVIFLDTADRRDLDLGRHGIRPETRRRFGEFVQALARQRRNARLAFLSLYGEFGDSYFFYHTFGCNYGSFPRSGNTIEVTYGREKGTVPFCAQHPAGRSGKRGLSPFPPRMLLECCRFSWNGPYVLRTQPEPSR